MQPGQNMLAAGRFAAFSPSLAVYSTLDFTRSPVADKGTWHLLPTTSALLLTATKHFDRAACDIACSCDNTIKFIKFNPSQGDL